MVDGFNGGSVLRLCVCRIVALLFAQETICNGIVNIVLGITLIWITHCGLEATTTTDKNTKLKERRKTKTKMSQNYEIELNSGALLCINEYVYHTYLYIYE